MSRAALFSKRNILISLVALAAVLIPSGAYLLANDSGTSHNKDVKGVASSSNTTETSVEVTSKSSQNVDSVKTENQSGYVTYTGQQGKTALELLKGTADVKTESSEFGELVTEINGLDGGGEKYWIFYVDGEMAEVGAGEYKTKNGEQIEWKLQ